MQTITKKILYNSGTTEEKEKCLSHYDKDGKFIASKDAAGCCAEGDKK